MKKIGITGSIASGKTTASQILSGKRGPLFSADTEVKNLYKNKNFQRLIMKKFDIRNKVSLKKSIRKKILKSSTNIKILEKIIHPLVRKKMVKFYKKNKSKKTLFYEIPLLIESKLMKYFDVIIFIKAKKKLRLKRYKLKGGDVKLFNIMNDKQLADTKKTVFCDHVVTNDGNLNFLKKNLLGIIKLYV